MADVFISYSRKDIAYARLLQNSLQQNNIETWIDWDRIPIGEKWWDEITEAIRESNVFIFIISGNSILSEVCSKEIKVALENQKRVIPIIIDDLEESQIRALAPELPSINWIVFKRDHIFHLQKLQDQTNSDLDEQIAIPKLPEFNEALNKLSTAIHSDWEWVKFHTHLQVSATRWQSTSQNNAYLLRGTALEEAQNFLIRSSGKQPQVSELQAIFVELSREFEVQERDKKLNLEKRAKQRQKIAIWSITLGLILAVIFGGLAWNQRNQYLNESISRATAQAIAEEQRGIAEKQSQIAIEEREIAETQREIAIEERNLALARQLFAQGINLSSQQYDLSILLGLEALELSGSSFWAKRDLYQIIQSNPRLLSYGRGHTGDVFGIAAHPSKPIVVTVSNDGTFILWGEISQGTISKINTPMNIDQVALKSAAISPHAELLAIGSIDGRIFLYDISNPSTPRLFKELHTNDKKSVNSLAFNPKINYLASGGENGEIILWDTIDPTNPTQLGSPLKWILGGILSLSFNSDGTLLAPTCFNKFIESIAFWDVSDLNEPALIVNPNTIQTDSIAFHPSHPVIAVGSMDGFVTIWDISDPRAPRKTSENKLGEKFSQILTLSFSKDGNTLLAGSSEKTFQLFDTTDINQLKILPGKMVGHTGRITQTAISADGNLAYSSSWDDTMIAWDIKDQRIPIRLGFRLDLPDNNGVFASHPSQALIAVGDLNQSVSIWNISNPQSPEKITHQKLGSGNAVNITFSPTGDMLAIACRGRTIELFSISADGNLTPYIPPLIGHPSEIEHLTFSSNGKYLASSDFSYHTYIWYFEKSTVRPIGVPIQGIRTVFSPDSKILVVAGDNTIEVLDLNSPTDPKHLSTYTEKERLVTFAIEFHPNGKLVYSGGADGNIIMFSLENPSNPIRLSPTISGHNNLIYDLTVNSIGSLMAVGSGDNDVTLWDLSEPYLPSQIRTNYTGLSHSVLEVAFSSNNSHLLSGGSGKEIVFWNLPPENLTELACQLVGRQLSQEEMEFYSIEKNQIGIICPSNP